MTEYMPEFFEVSLLIKDKNATDNITMNLLTKFQLKEGRNDIAENKYSILANRAIVLSVFPHDNFDEICIGFSNQIFHKQNFERELKEFTYFVSICFELSDNIIYALCYYETSWALIRLDNIKNITIDFLAKFPIAYSRQPNGEPLVHINLEAQDIFTSFPCAPL